MAQDFGETVSGFVVEGLPMLVIGIVVILLIVAIIAISIWRYKAKKWNLRIEVKLPRSDGQLIMSDKGKGYWDAENGWIVVKRKGYKPVSTQPIDPKRWLKGRNFATLIQIGPEDFIIASEASYQIVTDETTGQKIALMDIIADVGKRKTWKNYTERMGKKTFTLRGWAEQHQMAITLAIVIFVIFLGFSLLWMRLPSICPGAA
jgi:uncharacterized membrane protein YidH (DUF202 family)